MDNLKKKKFNQKEYDKQRYLENKEKTKERVRKYAEKNKEMVNFKKRLYVAKNKERRKKYLFEKKDIIKESKRNWNLKNKERIKKQRKLWRDKNRIKLRQKYKNYIKEKKKNDINFKISVSLRNRIRAALKNKNTFKAYKSEELLGCKIKEAKKYLEKQFKEGMTWDNYGYRGWHIDHIIPCASFDLTDPEQQKKCFHYMNLQPLWAHENMSKGAKIPNMGNP